MNFRRKRGESEVETTEATVPRFLCRTCGTSAPLYAARQVTNWDRISEPYRTPDGTLTYRFYNIHLPGTPGPPLAYLCENCRTQTPTLEELVLEPGFVPAGVPGDDRDE